MKTRTTINADMPKRFKNGSRPTEWDALIETFNDLAPEERERRRSECRRHGHAYAYVMFQGAAIHRQCRRCLRYDDA